MALSNSRCCAGVIDVAACDTDAFQIFSRPRTLETWPVGDIRISISLPLSACMGLLPACAARSGLAVYGDARTNIDRAVG
jgi:hypothetical protein